MSVEALRFEHASRFNAHTSLESSVRSALVETPTIQDSTQLIPLQWALSKSSERLMSSFSFLNLLEIAAVTVNKRALEEISSRLSIYEMGVAVDLTALRMQRKTNVSAASRLLTDLAIEEIERTLLLIGQIRFKTEAR
jgi:hypothetical protein